MPLRVGLVNAYKCIQAGAGLPGTFTSDACDADGADVAVETWEVRTTFPVGRRCQLEPEL